MFVDKATIRIKAGNGGTERFPSTGRNTWRPAAPTAETAAAAGSVVFVPQDGTGTLVDFRYKRKFAAEAGQPAGPSAALENRGRLRHPGAPGHPDL